MMKIGEKPQIGDMWVAKWKSQFTGKSGEKLYLVLDINADNEYIVWSYHKNREEIRDFIDYDNEICTTFHHKVA